MASILLQHLLCKGACCACQAQTLYMAKVMIGCLAFQETVAGEARQNQIQVHGRP